MQRGQQWDLEQAALARNRTHPKVVRIEELHAFRLGDLEATNSIRRVRAAANQ